MSPSILTSVVVSFFIPHENFWEDDAAGLVAGRPWGFVVGWVLPGETKIPYVFSFLIFFKEHKIPGLTVLLRVWGALGVFMAVPVDISRLRLTGGGS